MSAATKWLIGILITFNILMAGLMSILFGHHFDYKTRFKKTQDALHETEDKLENVRSRLQAKVESKQQQINSLTNTIDEQQATIQEQKQQLESRNDTIAAKEEEINDLQESLANVKETRENLKNEVATLEEDLRKVEGERDEWRERANLKNEKLQETLADLRSTRVSYKEVQQRYVDTKNELKDREKRLNQYVQRYGPIGPFAEPPAVDGYVEAVNPKMNIVLINLGRQDDVRKGQKFSVIRGEKYVTEVKVFETHKSWSVTRSIPDLQKRAPKVGDKVTTYSPAPESDATMPDGGDNGKQTSNNSGE